jgi:hypothetical protein
MGSRRFAVLRTSACIHAPAETVALFELSSDAAIQRQPYTASEPLTNPYPSAEPPSLRATTGYHACDGRVIGVHRTRIPGCQGGRLMFFHGNTQIREENTRRRVGREQPPAEVLSSSLPRLHKEPHQARHHYAHYDAELNIPSEACLAECRSAGAGAGDIPRPQAARS